MNSNNSSITIIIIIHNTIYYYYYYYYYYCYYYKALQGEGHHKGRLPVAEHAEVLLAGGALIAISTLLYLYY